MTRGVRFSGGEVFESKWLIVPVAALALLLLSIGVTRDYRLKHEDNNAMHATITSRRVWLPRGHTTP